MTRNVLACLPQPTLCITKLNLERVRMVITIDREKLQDKSVYVHTLKTQMLRRLWLISN